MKHDFGQGNRLWSLGWIVLIAAGCEESTEVDPEPDPGTTGSGDGTMFSPLTISVGANLNGIVAGSGETVYFRLVGLNPGQVTTIGMFSAIDDPDMTFHGFDPGFTGTVCQPFLGPGESEDCRLIPDAGTTEAFFSVFADPMFVIGSALFDVFTPVGFTTSVGLTNGFFFPVDGWAPAGTPVTGQLQAAFEWMYYAVFDSSHVEVPFPGNVFINNCDVNDGGAATSNEFCPIPSLTGSPPYSFEVNNIGVAPDTFTLTITSP